MKKRNSTKRALLLSALSLLMCVSMLICSTFAWFTDSVTSAGNKIQAGTLDVQLLMHNGTDYIDISDSTDPIFGTAGLAQDSTYTLWEPGKTQVAYLAIKNNGNLAFKYTVGLDVQNVSKDLYKVMQYAITPGAEYDEISAWNAATGKAVIVGTQAVTDGYTVMNPGDTHYFALSVHMLEEAGNEYMGGEVDFDLTIVAAQATVEKDSFSNLYDEDATRSSNVLVTTEEELQEAFDDAKDGDVITLGNTIDIIKGVTYNTDAAVTLNLANYGLVGSVGTILKSNAGEMLIQNGSIKNEGNASMANQNAIVMAGNAVAEIKDIVIETIGNAIVLDDNAKITELNAKVTAYCDRPTAFEANAIYLRSGNARIDLISGGEYVSTFTQELYDSYPFARQYIPFYSIHIMSENASIGEISGGTFLGMTQDGRNGATILVNVGKIEKISGGYFGFCKSNNISNSPYGLIAVNNDASIDSITGGTFEYAGYFGCDFNNIVAANGCVVEVAAEKLTVNYKISSGVKTKDVAIWNVVAP